VSEASIVLKAYDEISGTMKSVQGNSKALDKEFEVLQTRIQQLSKKNDSFNKSFAETSTQVTAAKKALKEAEAAFKANGDEQSRLNLDNAKKQYKDLTDAAKAYEEASRSTRKEISNTQEQMRKLGNESGGSSGSLLKGLMTAGLGQMVGSSVQEYANYLISSSAGSQTGGLLSSILGGAISGGSIGALSGNPIGVAIGAAVGGASGLLQGVTANQSSKDDAFKSYVQDAYNTVTEQQSTSLSNGSTIAGSREQTQIAFAQRLGSAQAAKDYLNKVQEMAQDTNYSYDEITGYSKKLLNTYKPDKVFGVLQTLSDATAGLDLNSSDVDTLISGLSKMRTTGKATAEYLNYFSERGVDVYQALADATGAKKSSIADMVTKGKISGDTAAQAILDYINKTFGGLSDKLASTYDAMVNNLQDAQDTMDAAMGQGYNEERKKGIQAQQDYLTGSSGTRMEEANSAIGAWQASLENAKEKAIRDAETTAMSSNEYRSAQATGDAAKMGEILARAQIQGINNYNASEGAQLELESQKALIGAVRDDSALNTDYYDAGYELGNQFTLGRAAAMSSNNTSDFGPTINSQSSASDILNAYKAGGGANSDAFGLDYVPYDNYPALLHQGEKVLTAAQARQKGGSGGVAVSFAGANFTVRQDSDVDAIAEAIVTKLERSAMTGED